MLYIHVCPSSLRYVKVRTNNEPFGAGWPPRCAPLLSNGATAHFPPLLLMGAESTRGGRPPGLSRPRPSCPVTRLSPGALGLCGVPLAVYIERPRECPPETLKTLRLLLLGRIRRSFLQDLIVTRSPCRPHFSKRKSTPWTHGGCVLCYPAWRHLHQRQTAALPSEDSLSATRHPSFQCLAVGLLSILHIIG